VLEPRLHQAQHRRWQRLTTVTDVNRSRGCGRGGGGWSCAALHALVVVLAARLARALDEPRLPDACYVPGLHAPDGSRDGCHARVHIANCRRCERLIQRKRLAHNRVEFEQLQQIASNPCRATAKPSTVAPVVLRRTFRQCASQDRSDPPGAVGFGHDAISQQVAGEVTAMT
jgi:hypothetical protein